MVTKENPPAFLQLGGISSRGHATGMSLRDYFAGQVLTSLNVWDVVSTYNGKVEHPENVASIAYDIADALMEEREK